MVEYIAIHKCRLCGETIEGAHSGKGMATKVIIDIMNTGKSEIPVAPWLIEYHECKDGNLGITDFQGFKKVGD